MIDGLPPAEFFRVVAQRKDQSTFFKSESQVDNCPAREKLELFTDRRLGADDQASIQTHVDGCTACQQMLATLPDGATQEWQSKPSLEDESTTNNKVPAELQDHPRYRVTSVIGRGGMGTVYKADHRLLERPVVLKVIRPDVLDNPAVVQRFQRESKLAARMSHPNVVAVYEAEQLGGQYLLVMEYVEGVNLQELNHRVRF